MKILYPIPNVVSVWIGTFTSEEDFDQCVAGPITATLKLDRPLEAICEVAFEANPVPVRKLLEGFSGWLSFVGTFENIANARMLRTANAALVCYYLKCDDAPEIWDKMHFLGSCTGRDVET